MFDTSSLQPASAKSNLHWRDPSLTLLWLRVDGPIEVAHLLNDKRRLLSSCGADDQILAIRQVPYPNRQQVLVIDDLDAVRGELGGVG